MKFFYALLHLTIALHVVSSALVCKCDCPCPPNGEKLKKFLNCFAKEWDDTNIATGTGSHTDTCLDSDIIHCKTTTGKFCKFDGTNDLTEVPREPSCYYRCGTATCTSWLVGHSTAQKQCIADLYKP